MSRYEILGIILRDDCLLNMLAQDRFEIYQIWKQQCHKLQHQSDHLIAKSGSQQILESNHLKQEKELYEKLQVIREVVRR